jgi:3-deoxy-D-arabino-heptulosonate 7-phosphate (DAHP) synthase
MTRLPDSQSQYDSDSEGLGSRGSDSRIGNPAVRVEPVRIGSIECGTTESMTLIAGPCVIESLDLCLQIAEACLLYTSPSPRDV